MGEELEIGGSTSRDLGEQSSPQERGQNWHEPRELTEDEQQAFLDYVKEHRGSDEFSVKAAALAAGVKTADVKLMRKQHEEFDEDYRNARGYGSESVMNAMVRLGINGVDEPMVSAGKVLTNPDGSVMTKRVYDSRAAIELFKALTPDGKAALAGKFGIEINLPKGAVQIQQGVSFDEVANVLRAAGKLPELEAPEGTAEVVDERDEPA